VEVTESGLLFLLLIVDVMGGECPQGEGVKEIPAVETETGINLFPFRGVSERKVQ
jgi:hypothetical protein